MAIDKQNGDVIKFVKQKDYIMVNNDLGGGAFGKTVVLKDPYIGELLVAKKYEPIYKGDRERFYKNFLDEIRILYKLNHRNIVRIFSYYAYESIYSGYILMEFIDGLTIDKYLKTYNEEMSDFSYSPTPDSIFIQLIDAFVYMEKHHIIHRDIREGNIMIDKSGIVKVIDFGIGKQIESTQIDDSLNSQINRWNVDTLPQEYYEKEYTSLTDMFYLAELLNRLMRKAEHPEEIKFSYQNILDKMMQKKPEDRYSSFEEIRKAINKNGFAELEISEGDKEIYHSFVDVLFNALIEYTSERQFNTSPDFLCDSLHKALQNNIFEEDIQKNADVISSVVQCGYKYHTNVKIPCEVVKAFLIWYEAYELKTKEIILQNIISKLSLVKVNIMVDDLPF